MDDTRFSLKSWHHGDVIRPSLSRRQNTIPGSPHQSSAVKASRPIFETHILTPGRIPSDETTLASLAGLSEKTMDVHSKS
jgi:hypothetical protein